MSDSDISGLTSAGALDGTERLIVERDGMYNSIPLHDLKKNIVRPASYNPFWQRPKDWLPLPPTSKGRIDILTAVFDRESTNFAKFYVTVGTAGSGYSDGTMQYRVDWGDGSYTIMNNDVNQSTTHKVYKYSDLPASSWCSRGYRQAIISITPVNPAHAIHGIASSTYSNDILAGNNFLEVQVNDPGFGHPDDGTGMGFDGAPLLESVIIHNAIGFGSYGGVNTTNKLLNFERAPGLKLNWNHQWLTDGLYRPPFEEGDTLRYPEYGVFQLGRQKSYHEIVIPASFGNLQTIQQILEDGSRCRYLKFAPGTLGSVTNADNAFQNASTLMRIDNCEIPISFDISNCRFNGAELDRIYTALPTVTGKTITVTGNPGIGSDTPSIATAKGWTVTGS